jgi:membrane protease YdiL (CAAX protease family)
MRATGKIWAAISSRPLFFLTLQSLIAIGFTVQGKIGPFEAAGAYWPLIAAAANGINFSLLLFVFKSEGSSYWVQIWNFEKKTVAKDILVMVGLFAAIAPIAYLPNLIAAKVLFGTPEAVIPLLFHPIPLWAAYLQLLVFPLTIVFAELPLYFGYGMTRLKKAYGGWCAFITASSFLTLQHCFLPFILDFKYLVWRFIMFMPLAFVLGLIYKWRPRLLPYMLIGHGLLDISTAYMVILGAKGMLY